VSFGFKIELLREEASLLLSISKRISHRHRLSVFGYRLFSYPQDVCESFPSILVVSWLVFCIATSLLGRLFDICVLNRNWRTSAMP
jgi:hypothetical protein